MSRAAEKTATEPHSKNPKTAPTKAPATKRSLSPGHLTVIRARSEMMPTRAQSVIPEVATRCKLLGGVGLRGGSLTIGSVRRVMRFVDSAFGSRGVDVIP